MKLHKEDIYDKFTNIYEGDDEKLRLLLRKGVYPYEYIDWGNRFDETQLLSKKKNMLFMFKPWIKH